MLKPRQKAPSTGAKIREIAARLEAAYSTPDLGNKADACDEIIFIILTLQTNQANFVSVWNALKARFPTWDDVLRARTSTIAKVLKPAGLGRQKARYIREILRRIKADQGDFTFKFLRALPTDEAEAYLTSLPGVGLKAARCVLLYSLGRAVFPVDTHVFRIFRRLGLVPKNLGRKTAHDPLQKLVPSDLRYSLHVNCVVHGRKTCTAKHPSCNVCVLRDICPTSGIQAVLGPDKREHRQAINV